MEFNKTNFKDEEIINALENYEISTHNIYGVSILYGNIIVEYQNGSVVQFDN